MNKDSEGISRSISFLVNGKKVTITCDPQQRLIDILREDLELTGTKEGCSEGACGTCTVLLDGKPVKSCTIPMSKVEGHEVTTIEGLGSIDAHHPLQQAFVEAGAIQCGFCTPGMLMRAKSLLDQNINPSRQDVIQALSSNLCRCTGYKKIVDAVMAGAEKIRNPSSSLQKTTPMEKLTKVHSEFTAEGQPYHLFFSFHGKRDELSQRGAIGSNYQLGAWEKALGLTKYAADITPENCVHLKVLRSEKHHALIKEIDAKEALCLPGVLAVYTARDIGGTTRVGPIFRDQPILADDRVRFLGEAVAVVVAESPQIAEKAVSKARIRYEELTSVFEPSEALKPVSPTLHGDTNLLAASHLKKGDIEKGFSQSEVIVESSYETPFIEPGYLEPEAAVAWKDNQGHIIIRLSSQNPHENHAQVTEALGIPPDQLRVIQAPTGGGFGGRMNHHVAALTALAALKLSKPAKLVYRAAESIISTEKRHPFTLKFRTGATKQGKLIALEAEFTANTGAYASYGSAVIERALIHATGPYEIPNVYVIGSCVYTNAVPAGAMRGFGAPQVAFAMESQMDMLAEKLNLDPFEFRRKNIFRKGSHTATGQKLEASVGAEETLNKIEPYYHEAVSWASSSRRETASTEIKRGVGVSSIFFGIGEGGFRNPSEVGIRLSADGWIELLVGAADIGQGILSALAQIAADTLDVPIEIIRVIPPDTDVTPNSGPTEASRQTMFSGNAIRQAAASLKSALSSIVPEAWDKEENAWRARFTRLYDRCKQEGIATEHFGYYTPTNEPIDETGKGKPHMTYGFASHVAQVEVDVAKGTVKVLKLVSAQDVGKAINPLVVEGQIEGGVMQAVGNALKEDFIPGITRKWSEYKLPRTTDLPDLVTLLVEEESPEGPFGAKGIGEVAIVGPAAAIINAVTNACGIRASRLPLTPDQLKADLKTAGSRLK
jgi:CO/xanthine dehydrogenase Mo-binding subunit/aerobic-type carbon monoxide dehydrogenase small subunit (CoxS/CutS family)